jgi:hypothetical protein
MYLFASTAYESISALKHQVSIENLLFVLCYGLLIIVFLWSLSELLLSRKVSLANG